MPQQFCKHTVWLAALIILTLSAPRPSAQSWNQVLTLCRSSLDECRNQSLDDVMAAVMTAPIPINYGPWLRMSKEGMSFLKHLLLRDPTQRLTASEALEHPWFKAQFGWADEPAAAGDSGTGADDAGKPLGGSSSLGNNIVPIAPRCSLLHPRQTGQGHSSVHSATL